MNWRCVGFLSVGLLGIAMMACDRTAIQQAFSADPQLQSTAPEAPETRVDQSPTPMPSGTPTQISAEPNSSQSSSAQRTGSLDQIPVALQPFVRDVAQLEVIGSDFVPHQPISRALFARWLVETNNRLYRDRPVRQIRLPNTAKSIFQDVSPTDPNFAYIQGLAESGYLPSPLSGDSTQTRFRPKDPLTRETLLLWKVPVDRQKILPTVSADRVKQLWGFKDANRITPIALSAVAADHQNGDLSNIRRVLGSTLLFQPQKPVTQAEATAALWFIGIEGEALSVQDFLRAEQQAKAAGSSVMPDSGPSNLVGPPTPSAPPLQNSH
jgi:hypothetical protein